jgi:hypothetical protein
MESMIPKADLVDGAWYVGRCRNAVVAQWCAKGQCFYYIRRKFGERFIEDIRHPDDDRHYDVFIPLRRIEG